MVQFADELAWNYNDQATDSDDSCLYGPNGCASIGDANWSGFDLGAYPVEFSLMYGVSAEEETVVHVPATMVEATSGSTFSVQDLTLMNAVGMPQGMSVDFPEAAIGADHQACAVWSGTPSETGTFVVTWTGDLILSLFGAPFPVGARKVATARSGSLLHHLLLQNLLLSRNYLHNVKLGQPVLLREAGEEFIFR